MNRGPWLFLGVLATLAASFWGLVLAPQIQVGRQGTVPLAATGELYPLARPGQAVAGQQVYRALGCADCHTRQVRARNFGTDFARGWGLRFSVAQDYLRDYPVMLGDLRVGPDLANIAQRQTNAVWHYVHLHNPRLTSPGSLMPRYPFLFQKQPLAPGRPPAPDALPVTPPGADHQIIPTEDARTLVAYLLSLRADAPLFEAPLPPSPTNAPPSTNAPAGATNAPGAAATNPPATPPTNVPGAAPTNTPTPPATNAPSTNAAPAPATSLLKPSRRAKRAPEAFHSPDQFCRNPLRILVPPGTRIRTREVSGFGFRFSDFFRISDFGFRMSPSS